MEDYFAAWKFGKMESARGFSERYSRMKFGSDKDARQLAEELGDAIYAEFQESLKTQQCVVVPAASDRIPVAATVLARHLFNRLNEYMAMSRRGRALEWSTIHRTKSYIRDYSQMTEEERRREIAGDKFSADVDYLRDKLVIVVDDVRVSGAHEHKIREFLESQGITNTLFVYYASFHGRGTEVEPMLNHAAVTSLSDLQLLGEENRHHMVVRAVKFVLGSPILELQRLLLTCSDDFLDRLYHACVAENYGRVKEYRKNFRLIRREFTQIRPTETQVRLRATG